jgi:uncharacterized lipoprotein YddW (UPF0748 family)
MPRDAKLKPGFSPRVFFFLRRCFSRCAALFVRASVALVVAFAIPHSFAAIASIPEVRGTWLTTTANDAIATPESTARTMAKLADIGINTVYVEVWKNGYTQFPSRVLERAIGVRERPASVKQDPSDQTNVPSRDLLQETLIEAHRNGLIYVAWFEYGFMAAHQSTFNRLRTMKPEWLSRNLKGSEVAPNGFVWMNPLHPEARAFLLDLVLEAIDRYDIDGIQLDDRIVWPHITMGYDDYTKKIYALEHNGALPPEDHTDPAWMRWRAGKVDEFAKWFVQEVRAKRPGLLISLSPAVHPWAWENYLLDWPKWAAWTARDRVKPIEPRSKNAATVAPRWDEIVPQAYRFSYEAFEKTWLEQNAAVREIAPERMRDLVAGIRLVGEGQDSTWEQLEKSMSLAQRLGNGGHVHWFSRGVLDLFPKELTKLYARAGRSHHPQFPVRWRAASLKPMKSVPLGANSRWYFNPPSARYRAIGKRDNRWVYLDDSKMRTNDRRIWSVPASYSNVELIIDRRSDMGTIPACRIKLRC